MIDSRTNKTNGFIEAINDDESLKIFMRKMAEFDHQFCEMIASQADFTLRLEVKGNKGSLNHVRICKDDIERTAFGTKGK